MGEFQDKIEGRISYLEKLIEEKRKEVSKLPKGRVHIARSGNRVQYYYKDELQKVPKKYLKKSETALIRALCQKDYDEKVLGAMTKEYDRLQNLKSLYENGVCENVYERLHVDRKPFVVPIELPEEEYVKQWLDLEYSGKGFGPEAPEYYTDKGERVRSKSEIIIANLLRKHDIPYRYEAPLHLRGYGTIHPDFTVLNVRRRREYYFEHLGMMDDPEYAQEALQRIEAYGKNNIFPGNGLILTHETLRRPLNSRYVEKVILHYLK